jgi:lysozyme
VLRPRRRRTVTVLTATVVVLALGAGLAAWGLWTGVLRVNYPSADEFPVRGIDVSHYQGRIDWPQLRGEGLSFAYVKATEGGDVTDPSYAENVAGARAAGLKVGAYHFFTFCRDGAEQARHAVQVIGRDGDADLPLVVDLEFGGNCSRTPSPAELDRQFAAFEAVVRAELHRAPVLYVTQDVVKRYLAEAPARGSSLAGHRWWVRSIVGGPGGRCGQWAFWQYANRGQVRGVHGPVDLDVYCGGRPEWAREFA